MTRNPVAFYGALVALCLLFVGVSMAQTVPGSLTLRWQLPTTGCLVGVEPPVCDLPLDAPLQAVHVWIDTSPIPDQPTTAPTLTLSGSSTTTQHTLQVLNGQTLYARVSARNASGSGPLSNEISEQILLEIAPGAPTEVTIELTIVP